MAAIFGPGGPIILPWTVRGDHFSGGTVHGVTEPPQNGYGGLYLDFQLQSLYR